MRILTDWLAEFVELPTKTEELANRLTDIGLEVDSILNLDQLNQGVVSARVEEISPHPDRDDLKICQVTDGSASNQVVTAAPRVQSGQTYLWAPPGSILNGDRVEAIKFAGLNSEGLLCSSRELGLTAEAQTLLTLPGRVEPGEPAAQILDLEAPVFELDLTPNRSDCLSHLGVARDFAAAENLPLNDPRPDKLPAGVEDSAFEIEIEEPEACWSYTAVPIVGVNVTESSFEIQKRILKMGLRPLNNIVDITNYTLFEVGHPLHPFDADQIQSPVVVRYARRREKLVTLDDEERNLTPEDLVIADRRRPQALAGIMGGARSQVRETTDRVLLEGAYFEPTGIRSSAQAHKLSTEASHRFERGVDPKNYDRCLARCLQLFEQDPAQDTDQMQINKPASCRVKETPSVRISYDPQLFEQIIGYEVGPDKTSEQLQKLGLTVEQTAEKWQVNVPAWRSDLRRAEDLVEEVVRLQGYEQIPVTYPHLDSKRTPEHEVRLQAKTRNFLAHRGFNENINFSFLGPDEHHFAELPGEESLQLANPLAVTQKTMRQTLLDTLVTSFENNFAAGNEELSLFEIGRVFPGHREGESLHLALLTHAHIYENHWDDSNRYQDFFDVKGLLKQLFERLRLPPFQLNTAQVPGFTDEQSTIIMSVDRQVGRLGRISEDFLEHDYPGPVFAAELNLDALPELQQPRHYSGFSTQPPVKRDLDLVVDLDQQVEPLKNTIRESADWLEEINLFDLYRGEPLPADKKSVSFRLLFRAADRSLKDDEVNEVQDKILSALNQQYNAQLRDE